jgi:hypothetical protein
MSGLNLSMCATVRLILSLSVRASIYMRVLIAAVRPKNVPQGLFRMFRLTHRGPREDP